MHGSTGQNLTAGNNYWKEMKTWTCHRLGTTRSVILMKVHAHSLEENCICTYFTGSQCYPDSPELSKFAWLKLLVPIIFSLVFPSSSIQNCAIWVWLSIAGQGYERKFPSVTWMQPEHVQSEQSSRDLITLNNPSKTCKTKA